MRALAALAFVGLLAGPALAEDKAPPARAEAPAASAVCPKKVFVGKGLERKAICVIDTPVTVKASPPRPAVTIVPNGGKKVTGRPKTADGLTGMGPGSR